jgi:hypothetical protein
MKSFNLIGLLKVIGIVFAFSGIFHFGVSVGGNSALFSIWAIVPPRADMEPYLFETIRTETGYLMHNHFIDVRQRAVILMTVAAGCWLLAGLLEKMKLSSKKTQCPPASPVDSE